MAGPLAFILGAVLGTVGAPSGPYSAVGILLMTGLLESRDDVWERQAPGGSWGPK
jgi:hypothetical protein